MGTGTAGGYFASGLAAILLSALGIALLLQFGKSESESHSEKSEITGAMRFYWMCMMAVNLSVALHMHGYFRTALEEIVDVLLVLTVLWICAWVDKKDFLIPNKVLLIGGALRCVLLAAKLLYAPQLIKYCLISSVTAAAALLIASIFCRLVSPGSIGFGDVKLLMLMGFCLQNDRVWVAVLLTMILSFFYSLFLVLFRKANRKTEMPFAPLLLIGTIAASIITTV